MKRARLKMVGEEKIRHWSGNVAKAKERGVRECTSPPRESWSWLPGIIITGHLKEFRTDITLFKRSTLKVPRTCQKSPRNKTPTSAFFSELKETERSETYRRIESAVGREEGDT